MSKKYELECPTHGIVKLEIEREPLVNVFTCPACQSILRVPIKKKHMWQPNHNYSSQGVGA